ncbi:MAG: prolipoprotein diacylglyceryl transferase [Saccharofermentans sp.]|nr:prolipoprotein diacylglyceryl transferase [Saccharofermentans sp.]
MYPFIEILGKSYSTYSLMAALGLLVSGLVVFLLVRKKGIFFEDVAMTGLFLAIGLFIGSHIVYGLTNADKIVVLFQHISEYTFLDFMKTLFGTYMGGMVFYGGLIGGIIALLIADKFAKKYFKGDIMFDAVAVVIPLFHTFGRIGCFLGGCCYGVACEFGVTFHGNTLYPEVNDVNRLPIQLIEAGCNLILFFILLVLYKKQKFPRRLLIVYFFMYPVVRFIDEFFRGDEIRGFLFGLSTSQIISIMLFVFAIVFTVIDLTKKKTNAGRPVQ